MKRCGLVITTLAVGTTLLVGCADGGQRLTGRIGDRDSPSVTSRSEALLTPAEAWRSARQLAWEAAVLVQKPPHPVQRWQAARVKWREAIQLLETIPAEAEQATQARQQLVVYRRNYAAITQRLQAETAAVQAWEQAHQAAWQAAMTVQDPPHGLAVWERATDRWGEAVRRLESVPPLTTVSASAQQKAVSYRQSYRAIAQQLTLHQSLVAVQMALAERVDYVNQQYKRALIGQAADPIGFTYEEYQNFVRSLEPLRSRLSALKGIKQHPAYGDMQAVIADYQFALQLWRAYEQHKAANADWLQHTDFFNRLVPLTPTDLDRLFQYVAMQPSEVRLFYGSQAVKVPLKSTVWEIWQVASDRMRGVTTKIEADSTTEMSAR